jgi:hypothetical protein
VSRIVETDNFGGDYPDEKFVLFAMPKERAKTIANAINEAAGPDSTRFWKVVENEYKLVPGFQP